ncbi:hypothetical protein A9R00_09675 [Oleispira antarctica]|uniref:Uncharacterized protein n=1 Tax=Oleispira antarctica TaxID=188908 RepID=A0A1Y5HQS9_OLEAN|nr:hypothetical protein A9R00_09675 [Oleispira antarctica]
MTHLLGMRLIGVLLACIYLSGCDQSDAILEQKKNDQVKLQKQLSQIKQSASYYLEVSNSKNDRYSTNSRQQSMQILLNPGSKVMLGESTWQSTPWRYYQGSESSKSIELELSADLQLSISISGGENNSTRYISGLYQLQENKWIQLVGSQRERGNKIISTQNKKQLWLRLHPANTNTD